MINWLIDSTTLRAFTSRIIQLNEPVSQNRNNNKNECETRLPTVRRYRIEPYCAKYEEVCEKSTMCTGTGTYLLTVCCRYRM